MRRIVLDTETTGLDSAGGHRIIEIGGVELIDRTFSGANFHRYLNPQREIDEAATEVHGMRWADLKDKPLFSDLAEEFLRFVEGAELVIHNAPFDIGFLNAEFKRAGFSDSVLSDACEVLDTLAMARSVHPGQRNSLDALCKRYDIDNSTRTLHGALLDAEILADVYLAMTGGQTSLLPDSLDAGADAQSGDADSALSGGAATRLNVVAVSVSADEALEHESWLDFLEQESGETCVWRSDQSQA